MIPIWRIDMPILNTNNISTKFLWLEIGMVTKLSEFLILLF